MQKRISRIAYAASTMAESSFNELFINSLKMPGQQAQRYNRLLQEGLAENNVLVKAISTPPVTKTNTKQKFIAVKNITEKKVRYSYSPIINLSRIRNIVFVLFSFLKTINVCIHKDSAVVCDVLNISASIGAIAAAKLFKRPIIGIVTDIPELMVTGHSNKQVILCHNIIKKCSGYVFLTEPMNERLNISHKPYIVIEGVADINLGTQLQNYEKKENFCLYAGLLDPEYGVKNMVDGFLKANIPGVELHICGSGPYVDELEHIVSENRNIVYHGNVMNKQVVEMEKKATLLINPRPSTGEFTKYSFPSKVMEYMSSGTATLATRLAGIPDEYYNYILSIDDETVDGMKKAFIDAFKMTKNELNAFGESAKLWVSTNKNKIVQGEKIIFLINDMILRGV